MGFNFGQLAGNVIGGTGHALGLPEFGLSEKLGGTGLNTVVNPTLQGAAGAVAGGNYGVTTDPNYGGTVAGASTTGTGAYGTGTSSTNSPTQLAILNSQLDQVNGGLGRLDNQTNIGRGNLLNSYNSNLKQLLDGKTNFQNEAANQRTQIGQDYNSGVNQVNNGVHTQNTNLQRLLGAHGAGNSSAAQILAPYAAAQQGNQQLQGLDTGFGRNNQSLDNSLSDYNTQYDNSTGDLKNQFDNGNNSLTAKADTTRASLLGSKGQIEQYINGGGVNPYTGDINSLLGQADSLGAQSTFTPKAVTPKAAQLQSYQVQDPQAAAIGRGTDPALAQGAGAYYSLLSQGDQKKKAQLLGA